MFSATSNQHGMLCVQRAISSAVNRLGAAPQCILWCYEFVDAMASALFDIQNNSSKGVSLHTRTTFPSHQILLVFLRCGSPKPSLQTLKQM